MSEYEIVFPKLGMKNVRGSTEVSVSVSLLMHRKILANEMGWTLFSERIRSRLSLELLAQTRNDR